MAKKLGNGNHRPTHEEIAQRAHAIYEASGCAPGHDLENWLKAETQLLSASRTTPETRPAAREMPKAALRH